MTYPWRDNATTRPPASKPDPVELVLSRLDSVRRSNGGWLARCPAHDDSTPSLSVGRGDDGRCLLKCWAGCTTSEIVEALGLTLSDLFADSSPAGSCPPRASTPRRWGGTDIEPAQIDFRAILTRWAQAASPTTIDAQGASLGVTPASLHRLDAIWSTHHQAIAFPMRNERGQIIGIRLRSPDGKKWAVRGSKSGVFIPSLLDGKAKTTWHICEGPTDTAAALSIGWEAIGRPSCDGGTEIICRIVEQTRRRHIIIVADPDGPGRLGAKRLADRLLGLAESVTVWTPPTGDLREWMQKPLTV